MSAVVADILIWRAWFTALADAPAGVGDQNPAQVVGLGVCAAVACLTTVVLVLCAAHRIRRLHAGVGMLASESQIGVSTLIVRTASAAIVALALAAMGALALGF